MCVDIVAQCDWCLFRRHITWEHCKPFQRIITQHIKDQVFPLPGPEDRCKDIHKGWGEDGSHKAVKIHVGACPDDNCVSMLLGSIKRKKEQRRLMEAQARWVKEYMKWRKRNIAWGKRQKQEIRRPPTESLLTLAFIEQEEDEEDEWEDLGTYDNGKGNIEEQIARMFGNKPTSDEKRCNEELSNEKIRKEEKPATEKKRVRFAPIVHEQVDFISIPYE